MKDGNKSKGFHYQRRKKISSSLGKRKTRKISPPVTFPSPAHHPHHLPITPSHSHHPHHIPILPITFPSSPLPSHHLSTLSHYPITFSPPIIPHHLTLTPHHPLPFVRFRSAWPPQSGPVPCQSSRGSLQSSPPPRHPGSTPPSTPPPPAQCHPDATAGCAPPEHITTSYSFIHLLLSSLLFLSM